MKIDMPEPVHQMTCRVLYGDTDAGGVVYYANHLRYFEAGRSEFIREFCCSYRALEERGLILPVIESFVRYKASAVYDDRLLIETSLVALKNVSCRFNYRLLRDNDDDSVPVLLAKGYTAHASVNRQGKLTKLPKDIVDTLKSIMSPL